MRKSLSLAAILVASSFIIGCGTQEQQQFEKAPRPVSVIRLQNQVPPSSRQVAGSVGSWKTEEIGFEVGGRVEWVLEPGANIDGRILNADGEVVTAGTKLAQLDDERYQLNVDSNKAQVEVAVLQEQSTKIQVDSGIPASIQAAQADLDLAKLEYDRNRRLVAQNAAAQAEVDRSQANLKSAEAKLAGLQAELNQAKAQLNSAAATILQARQALQDAERSLADASLFSAFRGQVAQVHVVPGSVVAQGTPVLTVQMMDPIKIDFEVSASVSRKLQRRGTLPIYLTTPNGQKISEQGYIYMIDPTADPSTRTFTVTLLMLNRQIEVEVPDDVDQTTAARTEDVWRLDFEFLPETPEGTYYVEQAAIRKDQDGHYLWRLSNHNADNPVGDDPVLKVEKVRVTPQDYSYPFLGNWTFQRIVVDDESFDAKKDLFTGEIVVPTGSADEWNGDTVILDLGNQWMLRPGDLVSVDLSGKEPAAGFYVPINAIYEEANRYYLFVATGSERQTQVKRIEVKLEDQEAVDAGRLRRVAAMDASSALEAGMRIIVGGVHFLNDGENVNVTKEVELDR